MISGIEAPNGTVLSYAGTTMQRVNGEWHVVKQTATSSTPAPPMFGRWIAEQRRMQEEYFGKKFDEFTQQDQEDWAMVNAFAAEDEIHEALAEISWKPWASAEFFNREAYLGEIVDALHFLGNMVTAAGFTDEDVSAAYLEKMERNRARQRNGYTGLDKCVGCGRAVDDIIAHGGTVAPSAADDGKLRCSGCTWNVDDGCIR